MLVFDWLVLLPDEFFNAIVHTHLAFVCLALSLAVSVIVCARDRKKPDAAAKPVAVNSDASKKTDREGNTSKSTSATRTQEKPAKAQPSPASTGPSKGNSNKEVKETEERGERKKKRSKESGAENKKEEPKGSIRISIHGAEVHSSDGENDEIYMHDIFDDKTATSELFPGESAKPKSRTMKQKTRKKKTAGSAIQPTQYESVRIDDTQTSGTTMDATNEVTKDTGYSPTNADPTRGTTTGDPTATSDRLIQSKPGKRTSGSRNKKSCGVLKRKKKSHFKSMMDPSQTGHTEETDTSVAKIPRGKKSSVNVEPSPTGETDKGNVKKSPRGKKSSAPVDPSQTGCEETESFGKGTPKGRKKVSKLKTKSATPRIPDAVSTTPKDQSAAQA